MNQPILRDAAVTKYAFEEVYFTKDSMEGNSEYTFQFPSVWNGLPTKKKAIGFRYAKCSPSSYYIAFNVNIVANSNYGESPSLGYVLNKKFVFYVTESNSLEEIVFEMVDQINNQYKIDYKGFNDLVKSLFASDLLIYPSIIRNVDGSLKVNFIINATKPTSPYTVSGYVLEFLPFAPQKLYIDLFNNLFRFFNQNIADLEKDDMGVLFFRIDEFDNCWDRKHLYIHSDITTNTNYQLIDRFDTFYRKPSKIYEHNDSGNIFHIWVSFDGKHKQELRYEEIEVALCFMADVRRSYV